MSIKIKVATPEVARVKTFIIKSNGLVVVVFKGELMPNPLTLKAVNYG